MPQHHIWRPVHGAAHGAVQSDARLTYFRCRFSQLFLLLVDVCLFASLLFYFVDVVVAAHNRYIRALHVYTMFYSRFVEKRRNKCAHFMSN